MTHDRAIRALTLQHHLHVGGTPAVPSYDDGSSRRPHPTYQPTRAAHAPRWFRSRRRR